MKGAPEIVFNKCDTLWVNEAQEPLSDARREGFFEAYEAFAGRGERVLGFARAEVPLSSVQNEDGSISAEAVPMEGLTFVGLISLRDPPKQGGTCPRFLYGPLNNSLLIGLLDVQFQQRLKIVSRQAFA